MTSLQALARELEAMVQAVAEVLQVLLATEAAGTLVPVAPSDVPTCATGVLQYPVCKQYRLMLNAKVTVTVQVPCPNMGLFPVG